MKKYFQVVLVTVVLLGICGRSSADNLDKMMERLAIESAKIEFAALEFEFQTLSAKNRVAFEEYKRVGREIARLSPEKNNLCEKLPGIDNPALLRGIKQKATRVVEILERARVLVASGAAPPETLDRALKSELASTMQAIAHGSGVLQEVIRQAEEECQKAR